MTRLTAHTVRAAFTAHGSSRLVPFAGLLLLVAPAGYGHRQAPASTFSQRFKAIAASCWSPPDPRQHPFGSGIALSSRLCFPLPFGRWPSLLGSSCARWGIGLPYGRPTALTGRAQRGFHVSHLLSSDRVGCLLYPREDRCPRSGDGHSLQPTIGGSAFPPGHRRLNRFRQLGTASS